MRVGAQCHMAHPPQQFREAGVPRHVDAHHQVVNKESDQSLRVDTVAIGDGHRDGNIVLARITHEQHGKRRQECHVQGCVLAFAEGTQSVGQSFGNQNVLRSAMKSLDRGTRAIRGKFENRQARERVFPIFAQPIFEFALQPLAFPNRVFAILNRQLRQVRRPAGSYRHDQRVSFRDEYLPRPCVNDAVMHGSKVDVIALGQTKQLEAQ